MTIEEARQINDKLSAIRFECEILNDQKYTKEALERALAKVLGIVHDWKKDVTCS